LFSSVFTGFETLPYAAIYVMLFYNNNLEDDMTMINETNIDATQPACGSANCNGEIT